MSQLLNNNASSTSTDTTQAGCTLSMASRRTTIALYRALLRAATGVQRSAPKGLIFTAARGEDSSLLTYKLNIADAFKWKSYGLGGITLIKNDSDKDDNNHSKDISNPLLYGSDIRKLVQVNFKNNIHETSEALVDNNIDMGFKAMSCLSLLTKQNARSSTHVTTQGEDSMHIQVRITITAFLETQLPSTSEYNYHYRVQVENIGEGSVQLCGRHWVFCNSNHEEESVVAKYAQGVVGATPIIPPGEAVQYASQCFLTTESGHMEGSFLFSDLETEELFEAAIAK
jgi:ApaG protein